MQHEKLCELKTFPKMFQKHAKNRTIVVVGYVNN